jgi:hypothetical protein
MALRQQIAQRIAPCPRTQIDRQALLVARIDLPVQRQPLHAPGAQRIAGARVLDLDHLRTLIGKLEAHHVARHQARQIDHANAVERGTGVRFEFDARDHCVLSWIRYCGSRCWWPARA